MAATVLFYHLIRSGVTETLTTVLTRAVGQGWRVMVRCSDPALAETVDQALWQPEDSFLAHAQATGGAADARQPVLIGPGAAVNGARGLVLIGGAEIAPEDLPGLERVWILFDGGDEAAVAHARGQWTWTAGQGLAAQYWSDESGSWAKKTERAAALA